MNVLIVTSEYLPLAKSGGLADAVTSLAEGLVRRGHTVDVVLPKYRKIGTEAYTRHTDPLGVEIGDGTYWCAVLSQEINGVGVHLIEHDELYSRDGIYGPSADEAYLDNLRRFAVLSRGALEVARILGLHPDILHAHDWPTAAAIVYLRGFFAQKNAFRDTRSILSIHNLAFQGAYARHDALPVLGFSDAAAEDLGMTDVAGVNLLKGAILSSDRIVTVSPTYAAEIQQPRYGFGLHTALQIRGGHLSGILNGIDTRIWNPDADQFIPARYSADDLRGKRVCKQRLQEELELPVDPKIPLIGTVTRLTEQKGIDELFAAEYGAAHQILRDLPVQWIVLGTGERWSEDQIRHLNHEFPNFVGLTMYSDTLAHRIQAGCDFSLMPSHYEPCGLNQIYSMRYGTIPIVTRTGGLVDTVDSDAGFHIEAHTPDAIVTAIGLAVDTYRDHPERIREMQQTGMSRDFGVDSSVKSYEALYDEARNDDTGRTDEE